MGLWSTQLFDICCRQFKSQTQLQCHLRRAEHLRFSAAVFNKEWKTLDVRLAGIFQIVHVMQRVGTRSWNLPLELCTITARLFQGTQDSFSIQKLSLHSPVKGGAQKDQQTVFKFQKRKKERQISFHVNSSMVGKITSFFL